MRRHSILLVFTLFVTITRAQQVQVESDKNMDLTPYTTFKFGEGEITTPRDQRQIADSVVHRVIRRGIIKELKTKGVHMADTGRMVITYIAGMQQLTDAGNLGPLGTSPNNSSQTYMRDYQQGNIVVDLNDSRNGKLIWRIRGTNSTGGSLENTVERILGQGFKKFSVEPKKTKRKRKS